MMHPKHSARSRGAPSLSEQRSFYDRRWAEAGLHLSPLDLDRMDFFRTSMQHLRQQLGRPLRIVDLGCGRGHYAGMALEFGHVEAVDLSPRAIAIARKIFPGPRYHVGNVFDFTLSFPSDVVLSSEVIEHVDDQAGYIAKCSALLDASGKLLLTTPNKAAARWYWKVRAHVERAQVIEKWLSVSALRGLLFPYFSIDTCTTHHYGYSRYDIMHLVNSVKLNRVLGLIGLHGVLGRWWERLGFGLHVFLRATRRSGSTFSPDGGGARAPSVADLYETRGRGEHTAEYLLQEQFGGRAAGESASHWPGAALAMRWAR